MRQSFVCEMTRKVSSILFLKWRYRNSLQFLILIALCCNCVPTRHPSGEESKYMLYSVKVWLGDVLFKRKAANRVPWARVRRAVIGDIFRAPSATDWMKGSEKQCTLKISKTNLSLNYCAHLFIINICSLIYLGPLPPSVCICYRIGKILI